MGLTREQQEAIDKMSRKTSFKMNEQEGLGGGILSGLTNIELGGIAAAGVVLAILLIKNSGKEEKESEKEK